MKPEPLSTRLVTLADDMKSLATLVSTLNPRVGTSLVYLAAQAGLTSLAAQDLERELRAAKRALAELEANEAEEAALAIAAANPARQATIDELKATLGKPLA